MNLYCHVGNQILNDIDVLGRIGHGWEGLLIGPDCNDACNKAKAKGLDKGDVGGLICCRGRAFVCVWQSAGLRGARKGNQYQPTSPKSISIINGCVAEHEETHRVQEPHCVGCGLYRHKSSWWSINRRECDGYYSQLKCLQRNRKKCVGEQVCELEVDLEIFEAIRQVTFYSGKVK